MRLTTDKTHDQYLQAIASQMGATPKDALNFLLWKLRESNYNFGGTLPQYPMPNTQQPQQHFDPNTFEARATAMSGLSFVPQSPQVIQEFEQLQQETDPVIARLASLIVDQF
jgi:hypothetical protein